MEWDAKMHSWDMPELGLSAAAAANSCLGTLVGTSNRRADGADCSVDLKLGGLGEFVPATDWNDQFKVSKASAPSAPMPSSVPSKRARVQSNGGQVPACLVEGCMADLSKCREYHRRHKVCEAHSKTPVVIVAGQEQRFCQQCSRFHLLVEFDEVKRSCRKRLDGHNRRRRKPQPDSLNPGNLFANHQEARFSSYPQMLSTPFTEPKWASIVKTETDTLHGHYAPLHLNCTSLFHTKERKHFPFLTTESDTNAFDGRSINLQAAVCRPLSITPTGSSSNSSSSRSKMFMPGGTLNAVLDSECALSLLSSPTPTPAIHLGQMISSADQIPLAQPLVSELQYGSLQRMSSSQAASTDVSLTGFSCTRMDNKNLGSIPASHEAHDTGLQYQGLYHVNAEGHSDGAVHALPFSW